MNQSKEESQAGNTATVPGLSDEAYLDDKLTDSHSARKKKQKESFTNRLGDNEKYLKLLEGTPYIFTLQGLAYVIRKGGNGEGDGPIKISNSLIIPIRQIKLISENETKSNIEMIAILAPTGEELPKISIPIEKFESANWIVNSDWDLKVIFTVPPHKNLQLDCIRRISKYMEKIEIYEYTGFCIIDGKMVFLHNGGAVGTDKKIKVDLGDDNLNQITLTDEEFDIKDTLNYTLKCLDVAPKITSLPILSLNFMAPLTSLFDELGLTIGFLTWVQGPQQCKKSSMVSAIGSHFGNFNKNRAPMNFLDGIPSAREKSAKCKDVLICCDDYFPSSNKVEAAEMRKFTEKLISLCADKMSGARSKSNGEMRKTYRAKGQIIATGETFPELSQSRMSRVLFINVNKTDVKEQELTVIQEHPKELQYSMKKYLEHYIENIDEFRNIIPKIFNTKIQEASKEVTVRTAEMIAGLYIGYYLLIDFCNANNVITLEKKEEMLNEGWNTLIELGKEQNTIVETIAPIKMFETAVEVLDSTGRITTFELVSAGFCSRKEIGSEGFVRIL